MKNSFIILILNFIFLYNISIAETFEFETKNIEIIKEQNLIKSGKGKVYSSDRSLEINADKFEYFQDLDLLNSIGNGYAIIKSKNLSIEFDKATFDQKNLLIKADGNIRINLLSEKIFIETQEIVFDQKENLIKSNSKTFLEDNLRNKYYVNNFLFEIDKNILKIEKLEFKDIKGNILKTEIAYLNTKSGKLFGKDVNLDLSNSSFNKDNQPRLKGNSIIKDENVTEVTKGVFTTCKKRDGCPPWQMSAEKIQHDKKKQTIYYKDAFLKVYDLPVMYFPKFFHPDPTVKRRSGFLVPTIKNSNSENFLSTPYFFAIAKYKDATFSPRLYPDEKILLQTEYRQANSRSNHITDFSYFKEKDKKAKNHIFYEYDKNFDFGNFDDSELDLKIQKTSNDTYLKSNKLKSQLINDNDILENSLGLSFYSNDLSLKVNSTIYEDLNKNKNDRYEYILPKINLSKKIKNNTNLNGNFSLNSQASVRNYNRNIYEKTNINDLIFSSYPKITPNGFYNNYEFLIRNSNTDNKNSKYKNNESIYLSSIFQYNSSLPLIKDNNEFQKILKPKLTLKIAPSHTKDERNSENKIDISNVYSINRAGDNSSTEGGISVAYGSDYSIFDKNKSSEIFNFKVANNLRFEKNDDLPKKNQIGEKTSNIFSEITFSPNEFFTTNYNSSIRNNLKDKNYENLITEFRINNFVTTFDYLNENNTNAQNSYIQNKTSYSLDSNNSLSFSTRKNKSTDLTEYYNFMYQYKNDCLAASIEYNKDYYSDRDLKPDESVFFKLTIIPFGETSSPNLKN
jgi:LPS-assembly protein